jgi:diguanylate cyclase (GGDEF)-like protein
LAGSPAVVAVKSLTLSRQLLLLSGIPFLALLAFAGILASQAYTTWRNVEGVVAFQRLITACEEYTRALPAEAILSLGAQETGNPDLKSKVPAARARTDAAIAGLREQAMAAGLTDSNALGTLQAALSVDLRGDRARLDAGTETLDFIIATFRPATLQAIELIGRIASLSTDAHISRLVLAYNTALWMNDAMLVERNVRPIAGANGALLAQFSEAEGIAQQALLITQFTRLAAPEALAPWQAFLADPSSQEIVELRRTVLGVGGDKVDQAGLAKWTETTDRRLQLMAPVLAASSASLRHAVDQLQANAMAELAGYALLVLVTFGLGLGLVWTTRQRLAQRIFDLCAAMRRLAGGELETPVPADGPPDELGQMTRTLASFKASLIERERLAAAQAAATAALLNEKERLRVTLHSISDGMIVTDAESRVTMMNSAAEALTAWPLGKALGRHIDQVLTLRAGDAPAGVPPGDAAIIRADGAEVAIDASFATICGQDGAPIGSITVLHDVTESRQLLKRISQLAHYDTLTGLPNRALFHMRLEQTLQFARRNHKRCALLFLDMDRFKHVNDTLGHAVGDQLLRDVAQSLSLTLRASDTVARLGGDEFVVILSDLADAQAAAKVAADILGAVARIDRVGEHAINVSFSIGIALYPDDATDTDGLIMRADAAMYQAKDAGRNAFVFFDSDMDQATQRRAQLQLLLARALQLNQFHLLYQPKVDMRTGRLIGVEALLRCTPDSGEFISPNDFIPVAEETGLIVPIGEWVINEACRQIRAWQDQGLPAFPVSVNVSTRSLRGGDFVTKLRAALAAMSVAPQALELEITESAAIADLERTQAILHDVRALGVRISIDDFGTGFSSLAHLRRIPADRIKIDRAFVCTMTEVDDDAALVHAIIGIATTLRKHVIAEGVETEAQRAQLLRFGCHEGQGYLFSRPVDAAAIARMITSEQDALQPEAARA